jgi:hypothetical protein
VSLNISILIPVKVLRNAGMRFAYNHKWGKAAVKYVTRKKRWDESNKEHQNTKHDLLRHDIRGLPTVL